MRVKITATLTLLLLLVSFSLSELSADAQRVGRGDASRPNVSTTPTPSGPKIETSGGPKTETKAGRRTGGTAVLAEEPRGTERTAGSAAPGAQKSGGASPSQASAAVDVGIIPGESGCPSGAVPIEIRMDCEDKNNANSYGGWVGATAIDKNITFKFCRVDGTKFSTPAYAPYAVLQLSPSCPTGSYSLWRHFHNETHQNNNHINVDPIDILPNYQSGSFTRLHFCVFSPKANPAVGTLGSFPNFGAEYGVLAPNFIYGALDSGSIHIDDQDWENNSSYGGTSYNNQSEASAFISGDLNTDIQLAKVMSGPPLPNLHSVSLNVSSVKGGGNGNDPILTVALDGPAPPGGMKVEVSSNKPHIARVFEPGYFMIPAGQSSGYWEGFLGTKNVSINRSLTLTVKVKDKEGYVNLDVTKN